MISDDFDDTALGAIWSVEGPAGTSAGLGVAGDEQFLTLTTGSGNFDAWGTNNSSRVLQSVANQDLELEARFLTTPAEKFEIQGILVEQDADNWLRFDTYSNGSKLFAFAAVTLGGSSSSQINVEIPGGTAPYLRVTREGDTWTFSYSLDGGTWTEAGSFSQALTVSAVGPFAASTSAANGYTAEVDYFFDTANIPATEDGQATGSGATAPEPTDDALATEEGTALTFTAADLLANDTDPNGDTLTITETGTPGTGTLVDNGDGTFTYTPTTGFTGSDSFTYTVTDGTETATANVQVAVTTAPGAPLSDDFDDTALGAIWSVEGPAGTSAGLGVAGDEQFLTLTTGSGNFDAWGTNNSSRVLQSVANQDLELEARFLTTPAEKFEIQGILVEQDADNWLRFDTYSNGSKLFAFAAVTLGGSSSSQINVEIPGGTAPYLRVTREGDTWTFSYSLDGGTWTEAGSFSQALTVSAVGPFAASTSAANGYTAEVDYFFDTANIPATEDGQATGSGATAPEPTDDALATEEGTALTFTAADLLANDTDPNGDTLTITETGTPGTGTLVDNGDGTFTYTPTTGFTGSDSFTYTVTDGTETATANVQVAVTTAPGAPLSDDFDDTALGAIWSVEGPAGTSAGLGVAGDEQFLTLTTGSGNFDAWGTNNSSRVLQSVANQDLELEARFLTTPAEKFEIQGILVEQDADNWLRFDTYSNGSKLFAFAAVTLGGSSSSQINVEIPGGTAPYLRVTREGDTWTFSYSLDGGTWTEAGSFSQALTVSAVGPFAASTSAANGYTAEVDYFFDTANIPATEDGQATGSGATAPEPTDDALATEEGTALTFTAADLLANDTDPNGDTLTITETGTPGTGTLVDNGDGTFTYTPTTGFTGSDSFTYTVTDGTETATANVQVAVTTAPGAPLSDDFDDTALGAIWSVEGPAGTSAGLGVAGDEQFLTLTTGSGNFDAWGTNNSSRVLQSVANQDLELEARFLTTPAEKFEIQGILVEQDADNWLRFDTYSNGSKLFAFAAVTLGGSSSSQINVEIPGGTAPYLRVTREGDTWTFSYSLDGGTWTEAGSFSQALTVSAVGPFAASTSAANGYTAEVDYFFDTANIPATEDGQALPTTPSPTDDALATEEGTALTFTAADLLANDTDPNGDTLTITETGTPGTGTLVDNGDGTFTYTPTTGFTGSDSFTYTVTDGTETATANVQVAVTTAPGAPLSDDFDDTALGAIWSVEGPAGTSAGLGVAGDEQFLTLTTGSGNFDAWGTNNSSRVLQSVANQDLELEARFLTTPAEKFEIQGILVEQDADNWLRFDTYSNGSKLFAFAAVTLGGSSSSQINVEIPGGTAPYLRVTREGDTWTFSYSLDGGTWTEAGSFSQALTVSAVGPFAASTSAANGYTAEVDYFFDTANIPATEDGQALPTTPSPTDDALATEEGTALTFTAADLLANDTDPNGDTLTITETGTPGTGTLVDNGDGTFTYTPTTGFTGSDSFTYTVTDGTETATANVQVAVTPPPGPLVADDFSGAITDAFWQFAGPAGSAVPTQANGEGYLALNIPAGDYDIFNTNNSARYLQEVANIDFDLEAKFLSTPTARTQMQGILVEQDADNWIRFDTLHNGSELRAFVGVTADGSTQAIRSTTISPGDADFLRVIRTGDDWEFQISANGTDWTTITTFTQAIEVNSIGPFAAIAHSAPSFEVQVDYVRLSGDPLVDDASIPRAPDAMTDLLSTAAGTPLLIDVDTDLLANDTDQNGDTLSFAGIGIPDSGALADNGDGTLTYTPAAGFTGVANFTYDVTDGTFTSTGIAIVEIDNSAPMAVDDTVTVNEDTAFVVDFLLNDSDPDGDAISVVSIGEASNGTVTNNVAGTVTYTPDTDFSGPDQFTYTVTDGARTSQAIVLISVAAVDDTPRPVDDTAFTIPDTGSHTRHRRPVGQ